jgi:hypothetical protein
MRIRKIFEPYYSAKGTFAKRWKQHYIAGTNTVWVTIRLNTMIGKSTPSSGP